MASLSFPSNVHNIPNIILSEYDFNYSSPNGNKLDIKKGLKNTYTLYLPGNLSESLSYSYGLESDISVSSVASKVLDDLSSKFGNMIKNTAVASSGTTTINPYQIMMPQGLSTFELPLEFQFIPENQAEADAAISICRNLKLASVPGTTLQNTLLGFPSVFSIVINNVQGVSTGDISHLYSHMVITNINITYSPNTTSFLVFKTGHPVAINLSVTFSSMFGVFKKS